MPSLSAAPVLTSPLPALSVPDPEALAMPLSSGFASPEALSDAEVSPSYVLTSTLEGLAEVLSPSYNLVIWQRVLPPEVQAALHGLVEQHASFNRQVTGLRVEHPETGWQEPLLRGLPISEEVRAWLESDLSRLRQHFQGLVQSSTNASLSLLAHDACRQLHYDYLRLRLIVTYAGPGTEWLSEDGVDRAALESRWSKAEKANAHIAREGALRQAQTGEVLLLKGAAWPGNSARGVVHRSPPIQALGLKRLVYKLDTPFEPHCREDR
ncbi:MAG: DUF1826 domain-containing protein [Myxococcota bacterium]